MAKKGSNIYIVIGVGVFILLVIFLRAPTVIIKDGGVRFDSIRKHPFDVLADPYHPPERSNYQQVGFLDGGNGMLPLFGRPHPNSSNRWEYYTMNGNIKLPISVGKKTCNSDTGCPEMLSGGKGDHVDVLGLGHMKSFIYDTEQLRR